MEGFLSRGDFPGSSIDKSSWDARLPEAGRVEYCFPGISFPAFEFHVGIAMRSDALTEDLGLC